MNLDYFEGFLETVHQKSIAKASEKLNITHPALSKQIRNLENYYGVNLFKRSSRGVELTDAGKILYKRIHPILSELSTLQSDLLNLSGVKKITIGTLPSLAAFYLPARIYAIEQKGVAVEVIVHNTSQEIFELLKESLIDAAIIECLSLHRTLWNKELFTEHFYTVVFPNHKLYYSTKIDLKSLSNEPLILNPPECSIRKRITHILQSDYNVTPNIKTEVNFGDFILGYVAAGAGITIVPEILSEHATNFNLKAVPITDPGANRTISLMTHSESLGKFISPFFFVNYLDKFGLKENFIYPTHWKFKNLWSVSRLDYATHYFL